MNNNRILALDGHDGVGKSTIAKLLADKLNGKYVRPFGGETGERIIYLAEKEDYTGLIHVASDALNSTYTTYENELLIFDRHWITIFSLLPKIYRESWKDFPLTILLNADLNTIKNRLSVRVEKQFSDIYHLNYLNLYKSIALEYNCICINTDKLTPDIVTDSIINSIDSIF